MSGQRRWVRRTSAPLQTPARPGSPARDNRALDQLLGEVRELRLTFVTDLSTAAGAVEAGAPEIAADILDADRAELARFFQVADDRLRELERAATRNPAGEPLADVVALPARPRSTTRRRIAVTLPAIPLVGALTMAAAAATGILPVPGTATHSPSQHVTSASSVETNALRQFETVVNSDPSAQQVIAAADKLHRQIVALMATSNGDPAQANAIAQLLQAERDLLLSKQPPGAQTVLAATRTLITQLKGHSTTIVTPPIVTPKPAYVAPQPTSSPTSKTSPTPTKTTKSSPTPTHSSSPTPTSSSSSDGSDGPLSKVGG